MASEWWEKTAANVLQERINQQKSQVFLSALKVCSRTGNLELGKQVHAEAKKCGCDHNCYVANALINMYTKCRSMMDARQVFESLNQPTVVSWNTLILGYAENGKGYTALNLFTTMINRGPAPDSITFLAALKACDSLAAAGASELGRRLSAVHNSAVENGCIKDAYVQSTLVDMYAKCGCMTDARDVFEDIKHPNLVSWTALILGYAENGEGCTAMDVLARMRSEGFAPDSRTMVAAIKAFSGKEASRCPERKDKCKEMHNIAVENGCISDAYVQSALIDMYAKCGSMLNAREVFDSVKQPDVVTWNVLILGYADNGQGYTALDMFTNMSSRGLEPDSVTFVVTLKACTAFAMKEGAGRWEEWGKTIHSIALENGCCSDACVQSVVVNMYAKCGRLMIAREMFDGMKHPDVVLWTVLILGYSDNGQAYTALGLFTRMRAEGCAPNSVTFGAALKACGMVGALEFGRAIHSEIANGNLIDVSLINCLVDFYAKCGSLVEAKSVFDMHAETRDLITWNALLGGFSSCGDNETAFRLFQGMQDAGLVVKGKECFDGMSTKYSVIPTIKHYTCMVDIFGRANKFDEALELIDCMHCSR